MRLNTRELRVCHIIHSLGPGGAEHVLADMGEVASSAGLRLSVISLMPMYDRLYPDQLVARGVEVRSLDLLSRWDPRGIRRCVAEVRQLQPDVVHTHLKHADVLGAIVAKRLGLPMVSTIHLVEDNPSLVGLGKRWLGAKARVRAASRTISVSEAQRRWYLETFSLNPARIVPLPNGVLNPPEHLPAATRAVRDELGLPYGAVVATMVGMMRPGKGHDQLIAAAGLLAPELDIRLVLAGDGPLRADLEAAARAVDPDGRRLNFAGFRADVDRLLAASDLIVHPSLMDALPTSLIQGLAAGLPVVASDVGGVSEIVTPSTGVLVPAGDPAALAEAIAELAISPDRRREMGAEARNRFEREFDAEIWVARLRCLYEDVLEVTS